MVLSVSTGSGGAQHFVVARDVLGLTGLLVGLVMHDGRLWQARLDLGLGGGIGVTDPVSGEVVVEK